MLNELGYVHFITKESETNFINGRAFYFVKKINNMDTYV